MRPNATDRVAWSSVSVCVGQWSPQGSHTGIPEVHSRQKVLVF